MWETLAILFGWLSRMLVLTSLSFLFVQGRHVKTGQLAAIKVMDVTEVRLDHVCLWKDRDFKVTPVLVKSLSVFEDCDPLSIWLCCGIWCSGSSGRPVDLFWVVAAGPQVAKSVAFAYFFSLNNHPEHLPVMSSLATKWSVIGNILTNRKKSEAGSRRSHE